MAQGRINAVQMVNGFEVTDITLDLLPTGAYLVTRVTAYDTTRGGMVGAVRERRFADLDEAKEHANGIYSRLRTKGWSRVR